MLPYRRHAMAIFRRVYMPRCCYADAFDTLLWRTARERAFFAVMARDAYAVCLR